MKHYLETERLILRPLSVDDATEMFNNWANDPEVTRYMSWNPHTDVSMTEYVLGQWEKEYSDPQTVRFGIVLKETGELFGTIDVVQYNDGIPELGYCIGKRFWGKGYMTEAATAVIAFLKKQGHSAVTICAMVDNKASNRVIQKLGLRFMERTLMDFPKKSKEPIAINIYEKTL